MSLFLNPDYFKWVIIRGLSRKSSILYEDVIIHFNEESFTKKILYILLVLLSIPLIHDASACECVGSSLENIIQKNDVIFIGQVSKIEVFSELEGSVEFDVTKIWKGDLANKISISKSFTSCDVEFEEGKPYLVMAKYFENELKTSICSGTSSLSLAAQNGTILILDQTFGTPFYIQILMFAGVSALLIIPAFFIKKRYRK